MLSFGFILTILIEIGLPFALAIWFIRRFGTNWKLFGVGVLTFIGSQLIHYPLLIGLDALASSTFANIPPTTVPFVNAVLLGLAAGICEETARWVGFRVLKDRAKRAGAALTLGAGHGGVESIIIGLIVLVNFVMFTVVINGWGPQLGMSNETLSSMTPQVYSFMSMPWYLPLVGAIERVFALTLHLTLSLMVWQAFIKRSWGWFIGAVLWHAFVDGIAVIMSGFQFNVWLMEGVIGLTAVAGAVFVFWFTRRQLEFEAEDEEEAGLLEGEIVEGEAVLVEPATEDEPAKETDGSAALEAPAGEEEKPAPKKRKKKTDL